MFPLSVRALLTVVALFVAEIAGALVAIGLHGAAGTVVASCGVAAAAFGLAVVLVRYVDKKPVRALRLRWSTRGSLAGLAVIGAAVGLATVLSVALGLTHRADGTGSLALVLVQAFVLQAIPEELLFRGYLVQTVTGRPWRVFALSTLLFGALHIVSQSDATTVTQRLLFLLIPIGFAAIATVLRLATDSVWPAVAVHGGFHVSVHLAGTWVTPDTDTYATYLAVFGGTLLAVAALTYRVARRYAPGHDERAGITGAGRPAGVLSERAV